MKKLIVSKVIAELVRLCKVGKEGVYYDYLPLLRFKQTAFKEQVDFFMGELINIGCNNFKYVEAMDAWEFCYPNSKDRIIITFIN